MEIPTAQRLLGELEVATALSFDAMHLPKTFEAAARASGSRHHSTGNRPSHNAKCPAVCVSTQPASSDTEVTTGRGRHGNQDRRDIQRRRHGCWNRVETTDRETIVRVTRDVLHRDAKTGLWSSTAEIAYYVANSSVSARQAATAIRCI